MGELTLGESIQAWIMVIVITIALAFGAGTLAYVILKPIVGWVLEPLEQEPGESMDGCD